MTAQLAEQICAACLYRRDAERQGDIYASYIDKHWWPDFKPPKCKKNTKCICLGWVIFVQNQTAAIQITDRELRKEIEEWDKDLDIIFGGVHEMMRYHEGEWFGSEDWRAAHLAKFEKAAQEEEEETGPLVQGELDL